MRTCKVKEEEERSVHHRGRRRVGVKDKEVRKRGGNNLPAIPRRIQGALKEVLLVWIKPEEYHKKYSTRASTVMRGETRSWTGGPG